MDADAPHPAVARELVNTACLAPSLHNSQPWRWKVHQSGTIELWADRSRQLRHTDPDGRDLTLSCGAALHHLLVAAPAFGFEPAAVLLPEEEQPDLLGRVTLSPRAVTDADVEALAALENRMTDRRAYSTWDVPPERLQRLAEAGAAWGARVLVLDDPADLSGAEALIEVARRQQLLTPALDDEQEEWLERGGADGVPGASAVPWRYAQGPGRPNRFDRWPTPPEGVDSPVTREHPDGLLAIVTGRDVPLEWLRSGMALSALWLAATQQGFAVLPQSQVIEDADTRRALREDVLEGIGWPQLLVRVGWPHVTHRPLPRAPRRPLAEVLVP